MTPTTTRNLAREVAMALRWEYIEEYSYWVDDYYDIHPIDGLRGYSPNNHELTLIPDYPNDLNACARDLTREGYKFHAEQLADNLWTGYYTEDEKPFARLIGWNRSDKLAVAWCESFLALCKHVDGQLAKGEQS